MFINTIEQLKQYIIVSATFDFKKVMPFVGRADRKFILSAIGKSQYDALVDYTGEDDLIKEVVTLFSEASANYAVYLALPTINTLITNSGTKTAETTQSKDADWREVRDLKRSLIDTANEAIDLAFEIMEANEDKFPTWRDSEYYTIFKDLVVRHTRLFNQHFNIQNSRKTFLALKPYMLEVEDQFLISSFGECTLSFLKQKTENSIVKRAQENLQKAVIALTISKSALVGTFSITETAFVLATEELAWERKKLELDENKLERLRFDREKAGVNYLQILKEIIVSNPDVFSCYTEPVVGVLNNRILKLKGSIAL